MWFIFPQIAGLGSSPTAQRYAVTGLAEAKAYLAHPLLGPRPPQVHNSCQRRPRPLARLHLRLPRRPQVPFLDHPFSQKPNDLPAHKTSSSPTP